MPLRRAIPRRRGVGKPGGYKETVGVSLLAIALFQSTSSSTDPPLSRAGSLLQGSHFKQSDVLSKPLPPRLRISRG
ncbi:hypothetical protein DMX02_08940 [Pseudomonas jessenii]|nr:hypothetical protein DMX02_08940 [Pseudomonas jessenii]